MVIKKLLIANRGEIAARIIATARKMGIRTVAVYHADDASLPFVSMADESLCLGGGSLADTYLNGDKIVELALSVKAQAIHPGYGFLSENAEFANLCRQKKVVFVGPSPEAIAIMGDKTVSRNFAQSLDIPVVQGYEGCPNDIMSQVSGDDFPLLVKPALGGGGKGMKVARTFEELEVALASAAREAQRYFNSDIVFVEHLVLFPRHIEVQVIADAAGNVLHLYDRECTLQRRFQKVVEEAPSPSLTAAQRKAACDMAVRLARECSYQNAGTVEFLLDGNGKLYFLEMNTRLQVEHPVTEMVTGIDIVEQQLLIAMGKPLAFCQQDVKISGCAIELRLIAEDAEQGFMPSVGAIEELVVPNDIRFDAGYRKGNVISSHFDSLVGKLVVYAPTRQQAVAKGIKAVEQSLLVGVKSNLSFLRQLLLSKAFCGNSVHTGYIDHSLSDMVVGIRSFRQSVPKVLLAAAFLFTKGHAKWRLFHQTCIWVDGVAARFFAAKTPNGYIVKIDGAVSIVEASGSTGNLTIKVDGVEHSLVVTTTDSGIVVSYKGLNIEVVSQKSAQGINRPTRELMEYQRSIKSPLNGRIVEVKVRKGQKVSKGALLLVVESMKMENSIFAPADATIGEVFVEVSQQVQGGSTLLRFE